MELVLIRFQPILTLSNLENATGHQKYCRRLPVNTCNEYILGEWRLVSFRLTPDSMSIWNIVRLLEGVVNAGHHD
jgi:hypothetical protein